MEFERLSNIGAAVWRAGESRQKFPNHMMEALDCLRTAYCSIDIGFVVLDSTLLQRTTLASYFSHVRAGSPRRSLSSRNPRDWPPWLSSIRFCAFLVMTTFSFDLSAVFRDMCEEAGPLHHGSFAVREKDLGRDSSAVATALNNLARVWKLCSYALLVLTPFLFASFRHIPGKVRRSRAVA